MPSVDVLVTNWFYLIYIQLITILYYTVYFTFVIVEKILDIWLSIIRLVYYLNYMSSTRDYIAWDDF